jgi:protocatechuate 3,4-dioxygenase beta subunit
MRKRVFMTVVLVGMGLVLLFLVYPGGPSEQADADRDASSDSRQPRALESRGRTGAQRESLEDMGARGTADAGSTPWLAQAPSEEDGVLEVEVVAGERPVPRASVRLYWRGPRDPNLNEVSWRLASTGVTDAQGRARLASRPGSYQVAVRAQGLATLLRDVVRPYGESRTVVRLTLEPGESLTGRTVEQGTRDPLPLVELLLRRFTNGMEAWQSADAPAEERIYASSDERGAFRVDGLAPGAYALEARAPGHAKAMVKRLMVPASGPLTVELLASGVIEGFVLDSSGAPAAGAEVHVGGYEPVVVTTGPGGGFSVEAEPGSHIVSARRGNEAGSLSTPVIISAGKTVRDVRIQLGQSAALEGSVVARGSGAPIEGARVDLSPYGNNGDSGRAVTDGTGRFSVEGLAPGSYDVVVTAQGYATLSRRGLTVASGERFSIELKLTGTGAAEGQVRDSAGQPVVGAQVVSGNSFGGTLDGSPGEARTDAEGHYRLEGLPAGAVSLTARRAGATIGVRQVVEVTEGNTAQLDFIVEETGTVEGRVRAARGDLPSDPLMVLAYPKGGEGYVPMDFRPIAVDAAGAFQLTLQPGTYELRVSMAEGWPFSDTVSKMVDVKGGGTVQVELIWQSDGRERDQLRGVVLEPDGTPSPNAFLTLLPDDGIQGPRMNAPADAQGHFSFSIPEEEAAGSVRMKLIARNGGRVGEVRGVRPGEQGLAVKLRPAASVRGRVVRASGGAPVKGFSLSAEPQDPRNFLFDHVTWEFPGDHFELRDIPAEPVRLTVRTVDGLGGIALVSPGAGDVPELEISVKGTAGVRGRVLAAVTEQPIPGALVLVAGDRPLDLDAAAGADGRFTLEGVSPGKRTLFVMSGEQFQRVPVTLTEGEITDVGDILLGPR